ncbi:MAG TPA: site-2 protease family protein [Candidatus Saccharimonadales bacterium]|nr:site-2 protease family protein [Candidatus Saccharimonadales bacterium]
MDIILSIAISLIVLLFSAILHEVAHGYVADRLGDPTARLMGRLTLNPLKHIDLYMTILLPLILIISGSPVIFGGAKPVPIDPFNLKEGKKDVAIVALAGPMTNFLLAVAASLLLKLPFVFSVSLLPEILGIVVTYNLLLGIFNLIPIPPLDGSKFVAMLLPDAEANAYLSLGNIGIFILLLLLAFPIGGFSLESIIYSLLAFGRHLLGV